MLSRRMVLTGAAAALATSSWAAAGGAKYLSAARVSSGEYVLFGLKHTGDVAFHIPLPDRGHAAAAHPNRAEAVAFARRPGRYGLVIDCANGRVVQHLTPPLGRHFYGHGTYTADGAVLLTTENNVKTGEGRIGLWSAAENYRRIGDRSSGGIGPHDITRLPDGGFAIANGGIRTHPDSGREKLNLATMQPNLTILDNSLEVSEIVELDNTLHQNSIRHLAVNEAGVIAMGLQWQGDPFEAPPLLALYDGKVRYLQAHLGTQRQMNGYAGSVSFNGKGNRVAITSPRGGAIQCHTTNGEFLFQAAASDVCGLTRRSSGFLATTGGGAIMDIGTNRTVLKSDPQIAWDNHIVHI